MGKRFRDQYRLNEMMGIPNHPPCANCGKIDKGIMGSSMWSHDYNCCSDRCGERLGVRLENGMIPKIIRDGTIKSWRHNFYDNCDPFNPNSVQEEYEERIHNLRIRIKQLEHKCKSSV